MLDIGDEQRNELSRRAASRTLPAGDVFSARLILALAGGQTYHQTMTSLQTPAPTISRWKHRSSGKESTDWSRAIGAVSRAWQTRPCRPESRARRSKSLPIDAMVVPEDGGGAGAE